VYTSSGGKKSILVRKNYLCHSEVVALTRRGSPSFAANFLQIVAETGPVSRSTLAQLSGLAPSTISLRVEELLHQGLLTESTASRSTGGRPARLVQLRADGGIVLAADLGSAHARLAVADLGGHLVSVVEEPMDLSRGPGVVLPLVADRLEAMAGLVALGSTPRAMCIGLPGPVDHVNGRVTSPSRMPGWHQSEVGTALSTRLGVPVVVDNDANLMAFGEYVSRGSVAEHLVAVKLGTGIGCGVISAGQLHRGASGVAGDIGHVRVPGVEAWPCGCGNTGCLETFASGAGLAAALARAGRPVANSAEIVQLVRDSDPVANTLVRSAGRHLGEVLAFVVNFFNPDLLVVGGTLANAEPLIAAVRAAIYERCLPLASETVEITTSVAGADAGVIGATTLAVRAALKATVAAGR
jgi:predicted NBD/HSP70 family sugar kinase